MYVLRQAGRQTDFSGWKESAEMATAMAATWGNLSLAPDRASEPSKRRVAM
jgi:hypothetical protein